MQVTGFPFFSIFSLSVIDKSRGDVNGEVQKRIVLLRGGLAHLAGHLGLEHSAEDGRHEGVRGVGQAAAGQALRVGRDAAAVLLQEGQVVGQQGQQFCVESVEHVAEEFVGVLLLVTSEMFFTLTRFKTRGK